LEEYIYEIAAIASLLLLETLQLRKKLTQRLLEHYRHHSSIETIEKSEMITLCTKNDSSFTHYSLMSILYKKQHEHVKLLRKVMKIN